MILKNGHIKVEGTGMLIFYVRSMIKVGSPSSINKGGKVNNVPIFYGDVDKDDDDSELDGGQTINASIFVRNAGIQLKGGASIYGNIFYSGEDIELEGRFHARAQVMIKGGGNIKGTFIYNKFEMQGGGTVTFDEPFVLDGPISPAALNKQTPRNHVAYDGIGSNGTKKTKFSISPIKEVEN